MVHDIDTPAPPRLAGALFTPEELTAEARKAQRRHEFARIPPAAYEELIRPRNSLFGRFVMINDPAAIRHVLVDKVANYPKRALERRFFSLAFGDGLLGSDGETWRTHRKIMAPAFDRRSVASYAPAMAETVMAYRQGWDEKPDGAAVDMASEMSRLTLQIISRTMFSNDGDDVMGLMDETIRRAYATLNPGLFDLIPFLAGARDRRHAARVAKITEQLDAAVERLISRRESGQDVGRVDLLDRLLAARDDETGAGLSHREVRDEIVTIFVAGHETTAMSLTWAWYLLSLHPQAEARLHAELENVLAGRGPTEADIANLPYTRAVMEEAMRLYPPVPGLSGRQAVADDEVCGLKIRAGTTMIISPWVLHRHRKLWEDPERFDPERFLPERSAGRSRFSYLPFGGGPRVCIGASLASNEATLILATLAQKYRARLAPDQVVDVEQRVTLHPRHGMRMILERRAG